MRVDAYTHFFPKKFFDKLNEVAGDYKDMGKRIRSLPALFDIDVRKKIVDGHKDYQQILSYPQPQIERFAKTPKDIDEFCKIINDGFVELCAKEKDHFPGWVAQVSLAAPDAGVAEAERALKNGAPIWLHPARGAETPDYPSVEDKSLYEIWWTIGWSYETACAMLRLVYSKIMDTPPNLKIITHHFAGIVPMLERRSRRPNAAWSSSPSTRSCSPPTARSIRKAAPCMCARRCAFSTSSEWTRRPATRCFTRTSRRSRARSW